MFTDIMFMRAAAFGFFGDRIQLHFRTDGRTDGRSPFSLDPRFPKQWKADKQTNGVHFFEYVCPSSSPIRAKECARGTPNTGGGTDEQGQSRYPHRASL